ncbi:tetratricopeptide repeat protein [Leptospira sp. 'Mane']|uniref:tetratricopeptide repeat protein n=1 Tax=Leptospira sp. 'Mane' TaxID=3387407 RepID=UPI00398B6F7F
MENKLEQISDSCVFKNKMFSFRVFLFLLLCLFLPSCEQLKNLTKSKWDKQNLVKPPSESDIVNWKEKLALEEAEIEELDKRIRKMVQKTNQAGALSWKIARAYMRAGSFDVGTKYYEEAVVAQTEDKGYEIHNFESALPYFEKAMELGKLDKQLLFEASVAFGNASRDMGWEPTRRNRSVQLLKQLSRLDKEDTRFPFQLALIYFDSSIKGENWSGKTNAGYDDVDTAFQLLDLVLQKEPYNVPARFAKANFLYQTGKSSQAQNEYIRLKSILEEMKNNGAIREPLEKTQSYQNVLKNLEKLRGQNTNF